MALPCLQVLEQKGNGHPGGRLRTCIPDAVIDSRTTIAMFIDHYQVDVFVLHPLLGLERPGK